MNNIVPIDSPAVINPAVINDGIRSFLSGEQALSVSQTINIPFLSNLPEEELAELMEKARTVIYPKQTFIISEGGEANAFFIILSGKVRVFITDHKSKEVTLDVQGPGTCFGEAALLTDKPRSVSVVSLEKTVCAVISKNNFINWLTGHPDAIFAFLGAFSERIIQLTNKVRKMALSNVYERTVQTLQEMAVDEGDIKVVYNRPTQQDLAAMVGASREMVSKVILDLSKGGYLETVNNTLVIHKKPPASW